MGLRPLAKTPPLLATPEERIPNRTGTVNINANKSHIFRPLSRYLIQFQRLLKKHGSILDNLFTQFSTFPATNPQMRMAH
jgi:hypothetical protein